MLISAMSVGIAEAEFWQMTPRQYWMRMKAEGKRLKRERDDRLHQAWIGEILHRAKKVPRLEQLLADKKPMGIDEAAAALHAMSAKMKKKTWEEWTSKK